MRITIWQRSLALFIILALLLTASPWLVPASAKPPAESKIGSSLSLRIKLKTEQKTRQDAGPTMAKPDKDKAGQPDLEPVDISGNLDTEKVFIRFAQKPTKSQLAELAALGVTAYPDSWLPPVGKHQTGFILANSPIEQIDSLAAKTWVTMIDTAENQFYPQNDLGRAEMGVQSVWDGENKGAGVTVAVLDSGIDKNNLDFPTLNTSNSKDYAFYPDSLDDTIANSTTGHGTHVAASVLGQGYYGSSYKGVAPEADLVFLKIGQDDTSSASAAAIIGAIQAAAKPVSEGGYGADIITMSYGGWSQYHDGSDYECHAVDVAVSQGVTVFMAAGNDGANRWHYSGTVNAGQNVYVPITVGPNGSYLWTNLVWYDGLGTHNDLNLSYYNSAYQFMPSSGSTRSESDRGTEARDDDLVNPAPPGTNYIRVTNNSASSQMFHLYYEGGSSSVYFNNPDPRYTLGSPAEADCAIAVGAYVTRTSWTTYLNDTYSNTTQTPYLNNVATFSSRGPRVDTGAPAKPNILAPGSMIVSARDPLYTLGGSYVNSIIDNDGTGLGSGNTTPSNSMYFVMQGTSMACPLAAGVGALILSAHPDYSPAQVKQALESTASKAAPGWDADWGWGLINAAEAVEGNSPQVSVVLQDDTNRPDDGWIVPLTVKFFSPAANLTGEPAYTFPEVNTTKSGSTAVIQCTGVESGIYDITAVSSHTLVNVKRNVTVNASSGTIDLGTLLEGNANNDTRINIFDFRLLSISYNKSFGQAGYNASADFNNNEIVDINDFNLLKSNYGKLSPILVP